MSAPNSHPPKDSAPKQPLEAERLSSFPRSELTPFRMNTCGAKDLKYLCFQHLQKRGEGGG